MVDIDRDTILFKFNRLKDKCNDLLEVVDSNETAGSRPIMLEAELVWVRVCDLIDDLEKFADVEG